MRVGFSLAACLLTAPVCVRAVATLAVKSCKDPRAQLLHVIDRLVGIDDIDRHGASL